MNSIIEPLTTDVGTKLCPNVVYAWDALKYRKRIYSAAIQQSHRISISEIMELGRAVKDARIKFESMMDKELTNTNF